MVEIEGKTYQDGDLIAWDVAERVGGFYFNRARFLGCPLPPACIVADVCETPAQREMFSRYHATFKEMESVSAQALA